jgi:menaquinone-specific isochorismate synthase
VTTVRAGAAAVGQLVSRTRLLPAETDPLLQLGPGGFAWLHEGAGFATSGVAATVPLGTGPDRIERAADGVAALLDGIETDDPLELPGTGPVAVGALPFLHGRDGALAVPARVVGRTADGRAWVTEVGPVDEGPARPATAPTPEPTSFVVESEGGRRAWTEAVRRALDAIAGGSLDKVVLARRVAVWADQPFSIPVVADRLRRAHPSCYTFVAGGFLGASPELLLRRRGRWAWSQPMAGTVERGGSRADDRRLVSALRSSPKERDEHRLVVEDVRRQLAARSQEVFVKGPEPVGLSSVTHLATTVTARLDVPAPSALALAGALHPTPAVAGKPREAALAAIAGLEGFDRGQYAGPVGWVDRRGDGDWAVAIRCAFVDGRRAFLPAGAGIVAGSEPESEWSETQAKLEPMMRALVRV